jgi:hypothetical protein
MTVTAGKLIKCAALRVHMFAYAQGFLFRLRWVKSEVRKIFQQWKDNIQLCISSRSYVL